MSLHLNSSIVLRFTDTHLLHRKQHCSVYTLHLMHYQIKGISLPTSNCYFSDLTLNNLSLTFIIIIIILASEFAETAKWQQNQNKVHVDFHDNMICRSLTWRTAGGKHLAAQYLQKSNVQLWRAHMWYHHLIIKWKLVAGSWCFDLCNKKDMKAYL